MVDLFTTQADGGRIIVEAKPFFGLPMFRLPFGYLPKRRVGRPRKHDYELLQKVAHRVNHLRQTMDDDHEALLQAGAEYGITDEALLERYWDGKLDKPARAAGFPKPPRVRRVRRRRLH